MKRTHLIWMMALFWVLPVGGTMIGAAWAQVGPPRTLPDRMLEPVGFVLETLEGSDGLTLRYGHMPLREAPQGLILVLQGYGGTLEQGYETYRDLAAMGLMVYALDLPGQGGSARYLDNPYKGHVTDFAAYVAAVHQVVGRMLETHAGADRVILLGNSMGGHVAHRYAAMYPQQVAALIMDVPMMDVPTDPYPASIALLLADVAVAVGLGHSYAKGEDWEDRPIKTAQSRVTSDPDRVKLSRYWAAQKPGTRLGGQTYAWVAAAFDSMELMRDATVLGAMQTPTLLMSAGRDTVILSGQHHETCAAMVACQLYADPKSKHGLLFERDEIRAAALAAIEGFLAEL